MMKDLINKLLKNKLNIALIILQLSAVVFFLIGQRFAFGSIMFFLTEGVFLILLGVKLLLQIRNSKYSQEVIDQLPYTQEQRDYIIKQNKRSNKNNKFMAIMLILLGIVVIFNLFSTIF